MNETQYLGYPHIDHQWRSTLTGSTFSFEWDRGWLVEPARYTGEGMWQQVRPGVVTTTVYAHTGEKFVQI